MYKSGMEEWVIPRLIAVSTFAIGLGSYSGWYNFNLNQRFYSLLSSQNRYRHSTPPMFGEYCKAQIHWMEYRFVISRRMVYHTGV